jgi:hypothetical protein
VCGILSHGRSGYEQWPGLDQFCGEGIDAIPKVWHFVTDVFIVFIHFLRAITAPNAPKEALADAMIAQLDVAKRFLSKVWTVTVNVPDPKLSGVVVELKDSASVKLKAVGTALEHFLPFFSDRQ